MLNGRVIFVTLMSIAAIAAMWIGIELYCGVDDAYAQWGTADRVIEYMEDNNGRWPPNWDALRSYYDSHGARVSGWSFADIKFRIFIDFNVNADELKTLSLKSSTVPFNVIHARWTVGFRMGDGPNAQIYDYLRRKAGIVKPPLPNSNGAPTVVPITKQKY